MTIPTLILLLVALVAVFVLPRRWVLVPFLVLACFVPKTQAIDIGPATMTPLRILTLAASVRALGSLAWRGIEVRLPDYFVLAWALLHVATVAFHRDPAGQVVTRLGGAFDGLGLYFVVRWFCRSPYDIRVLCGALCVLILPVASGMTYEAKTGRNPMVVFGASAVPNVRDGKIRAQGAFRHAILAGTAGALSLPLVLVLWPTRRVLTVTGSLACVGIVVASRSSGPVMTLVAVVLALCLWPARRYVRILLWGAVAMYLGLLVVMKRPPYYLIAMIDFTGSSTGWYRARLIQSSLEHLNEWWLFGTDVTRHWMAHGLNSEESDIVNQYIALGVNGGVLLLGSFLGLLMVSFRALAQAPSAQQVLAWSVGAELFGIVVTGVSVAFFDQSILWLYMPLAWCATLSSVRAGERVDVATPLRRLAHDVVRAHRARRRARLSAPVVDA
jgi:hypothetical protein